MTNKKKLVDKVCSKINYLKKDDISEAIDYVFEYIKLELANENRVEIRGFGSFSLRNRKRPNQEKMYKTIYCRMSKNVSQLVNELN